MGRLPAETQGVNKKGPWTPEEDVILASYIQTNGPGNWASVSISTGLKRCGKSCRLRWNNYLRPDLKRGSFTTEEEQIIIQLQAVLGNKWAGIAHYLPGRTDNDVKNFWNAHRKKRVDGAGAGARASGSRSDDGQCHAGSGINTTTSVPDQDSDSSKRRWERMLQEDVHQARKALSDALTLSPQVSVADHDAISLSPPVSAPNSNATPPPTAPGFGYPLPIATAPLLSSGLMSFKPPRGWNQNDSHQQLMIPANDHQLRSQAATQITQASNYSTTNEPYVFNVNLAGKAPSDAFSLSQASIHNQYVVSIPLTASAPNFNATLPQTAPGLGSPLPMATAPLLSSEIMSFKPPRGWNQNASQQQLMIPENDHQLHSQAASQISRATTYTATTEPYVFNCENVALWLKTWNKETRELRLDNVSTRHRPLAPAARAVLGREQEGFPPPAVVATAAYRNWQNEDAHLQQPKKSASYDPAIWPHF